MDDSELKETEAEKLQEDNPAELHEGQCKMTLRAEKLTGQAEKVGAKELS